MKKIQCPANLEQDILAMRCFDLGIVFGEDAKLCGKALREIRRRVETDHVAHLIDFIIVLEEKSRRGLQANHTDIFIRSESRKGFHLLLQNRTAHSHFQA